MSDLIIMGLCIINNFIHRMATNLIKINRTLKANRDNRYYLSDRFKETVRKYPNKIAIIFEDHQLTFREIDELSNRIANILRASGLRHGDSAAVFMENSLEYLPVFLGLCKLGVTGTMACILVNSTLIHVTVKGVVVYSVHCVYHNSILLRMQ